MNPEQREQVRENAAYLRNVRPIDPAEIHEYVEGQPHPAAVREVLRESAFELALRERDDGTFVPVEEGPIEPAFDGVERFPEAYTRALEDLLVEEYGPDWHRGESGERLRRTIRRLKADYYRGAPVEYDREVALGYAVYHGPAGYAATAYVLDELGRNGLLPRRLRVLDVGAGTGGPMLGLHDYLEDALVAYHAVEPGAGAEILEAMLAETGRNFRATVHRETAEAFEPGQAAAESDDERGEPGPDDGRDAAGSDSGRSMTGPDVGRSATSEEYDLLLFANVLNELDDPEAVFGRYLPALAEDGAVVAIAPADRETSIGLRAVERAFDDEYTVFSPTLRLWPGESPADRGWSFDVKPDLAVPPFQRKLDDAAGSEGEFVNVDVQYSHFILRADGRRRLEFTADPDRFARMADAEDYVTERVDLAAVKLSHDLSTDGNPVFKVGDGSERVGHFATLAKETALNRDLRVADYGDVLVFEGALVLWNDDEAAYNLVVDDETVVDRVPAP